jgi:DNA polymerase (family 10)
MLAHPSNRLLNEREALSHESDATAETAAAEGVAIEIDAQPERLDLDWASVKEYRDTVDYVVSTDAHTTGELAFMHLGVAQAGRGWCEAADVLNTRSVDELLAAFEGWDSSTARRSRSPLKPRGVARRRGPPGGR